MQARFRTTLFLTQIVNGNERVIEYAGRALSDAKKKVGSATLNECGAVIFELKRFDVYLRHAQVKILTDCKALSWLLHLNAPTGKFARMQAYTQRCRTWPRSLNH